MFSQDHVHPSWKPLLNKALSKVDQSYLQTLAAAQDWLPGSNALFNAFSIPLTETRYILFGESPYPRSQSANGYAFWDAAVHEIWSEQGLSKPVNRATSLRNIIKMLLVAREALPADDVSQTRIAGLCKNGLVSTLDELFQNMLSAGFLLLNITPVLRPKRVREDAKSWQPFMAELLEQLAPLTRKPELILFGRVAEDVLRLPTDDLPVLKAEHPYNISFIHNPDVINFFKPLDLLKRRSA